MRDVDIEHLDEVSCAGADIAATHLIMVLLLLGFPVGSRTLDRTAPHGADLDLMGRDLGPEHPPDTLAIAKLRPVELEAAIRHERNEETESVLDAPTLDLEGDLVDGEDHRLASLQQLRDILLSRFDSFIRCHDGFLCDLVRFGCPARTGPARTRLDRSRTSRVPSCSLRARERALRDAACSSYQSI